MEQTAFSPFLDVQGDSGEGGRNGLCSVLQLFLLVLGSAGKKLQCSSLGILHKASPTESIPSV